MPNQVHQAARVGLGTTKSAAGSLASSPLATITGAALPNYVSLSLTVYVVTGTVYVENDGTDADANSLPIAAGGSASWPNSREEIGNLRFFANAAYDARFVLEG